MTEIKSKPPVVTGGGGGERMRYRPRFSSHLAFNYSTIRQTKRPQADRLMVSLVFLGALL